MSNLRIAVDLAKHVFEVAVAKPSGKLVERKRLTRAQFEHFWKLREPCRVVMEACSSAHHWARYLLGLGFEVSLLPPRYVRAYRQRGKTDRIDCDALLEAARSPRIEAVAVKSRDQQAILALHRVREQWKSTRTMRINGMRGMLREFGVTAPRGANTFLERLPQLLERHREMLPQRVRRLVLAFWTEANELDERMREIERELETLAKQEPVIRTLLEIPGIGVLTATALFASIGNVHAFPSGRHLASWLGITPRENSSGNRRRLGRITKQGDPYLRTLHDPWRPLPPERRAAATACRQARLPPAELGAEEGGRVAPLQPDRGRTGQQARAHRLGRLEARTALQRRVPAQGSLSQPARPDNDALEKGVPYRGSARRDSTSLMAERSVRRRGKAVNKRVPSENICSDWLPVPERSIMARSLRAPQRPDKRLQPHPSAIRSAPSQPGQSGGVHIRFCKAATCP
jgi:transposase